jgi:hypothetical protein
MPGVPLELGGGGGGGVAAPGPGAELPPSWLELHATSMTEETHSWQSKRVFMTSSNPGNGWPMDDSIRGVFTATAHRLTDRATRRLLLKMRINWLRTSESPRATFCSRRNRRQAWGRP